MSPTALDTRPPTSRAGRGGNRLHAELQRRRSRRRRLIAAGVAVLLVVLLAVAGWLVGLSSVFAAREVTVAGQQELSAKAVQEAAAVPLGVPLARQDLDAIAQRAASLPQVASVTVVRDWPRTVAVTIVERRPVLAVLQPDGYALIDAAGVAYETRPAVPKGVLRADADPTASRLLTDLAVVANALPAELRGKVERLRALSASDIVLQLDGGATVRWGDARDSVLKAQIVEALLTKSTRSIDVSAPHTPATR